MIIYEKKIKSSFRDVDICVREVLIKLGNNTSLSNESILFKVSFVLREIMNNAVEHGNRFDISKIIDCKISYSSSKLKIEIEDEGSGFSIEDLNNINSNFEKRERNRGFRLIEELDFIVDINKNIIRLELKI